jgi:hypothetical protein
MLKCAHFFSDILYFTLSIIIFTALNFRLIELTGSSTAWYRKFYDEATSILIFDGRAVLHASFLAWTPRFNARIVHVGFAVDKVVLEQVFLRA